MIMKKLTLLGIIVLLLYGNCKDAVETPSPNPSRLPDLSLEGKYYFACLIDDAQWANAGSHVEDGGWSKVAVSNLNAALVFFKKQDSTKVQIQGNMYTTQKDDDLSIEFACKGFPNLMEVYSIDAPKRANLKVQFVPNGNGKSFSQYSDSYAYAYVTDPKLNNSANISFVKVDTVEKIISGVFYARVFPNQNTINSNSGSIPKLITQGRFDIKYQPYPLSK
jgi:hypothetical protein